MNVFILARSAASESATELAELQQERPSPSAGGCVRRKGTEIKAAHDAATVTHGRLGEPLPSEVRESSLGRRTRLGEPKAAMGQREPTSCSRITLARDRYFLLADLN